MKYTFLLLFFSLSFRLHAHIDTLKVPILLPNSVSLNILGDASLLSVHYDRILTGNNRFFLAAKLGVGRNKEFCLFGCDAAASYLTLPFSLTGNLGKHRSFFEFGLGATLVSGNERNFVYPVIGYRLQPKGKRKFAFRVFSNIRYLGPDAEYILFSFLGVSLGLGF